MNIHIHKLYTGWWFGTFGSFFHILGMSSSQLTFIFFKMGRYTTNQYRNIIRNVL